MQKITKIVAFAALMASSTAYGATPEWKISESKGDVNILRSGVSKIAISGGTLRAGDVVATGKHSRAVLVRGEEYVVVSPLSRLRISAPKKSGGVMQFFEEVGNVLFRIDKKATPHFGVQTPYLAAVVKGTTFSVTVSESGAAVQVTEGAVQVSTLDGGASQLLSPGMIGMVKQDQQYRLSITGSETKTIMSPNAPANDDGSSEPSTASKDIASVEIATGDYEGVISSPVVDKPVSFSHLTGGLVSDNVTDSAPTQLASNALNMKVGDPASSFNNGHPFSSNTGNSGNGAGNNAGGNGEGVGNSNAGGSVNGTGNSNAGGNGIGASNGNNAGSGNANNGVGNGNGGAKNGNAGSGASNSNAGGNGANNQGNAGSGNANNGAGSGFANNSVGNGNGGGQSGNGTGNSNAGGNGASNSNNAGSGNANNGVGNGNGGGKSGNRGNGN